jgi:hypothetical protein
MAYAAVPPASGRAEMWFDGPEKQRRWTVLIRFILAIPQAIAVGILGYVALVVAVIGWFGALFMGRLPNWAHKFNTGYTRLYVRYLAYTYLLTDQYPPLEFDDRSYAARPIMPAPGRLNRAAVFFRFVLVFPAAAFQVIITYGLLIPMLFVAWIIMVFSGRMPRTLYWAYSSLVRYTSRVLAYVLLLTPEYPWGMFGDRGVSTTGAPPLAAPGFSPPDAPADLSPQPPPPPWASPAAETVEPGPPTETPGGEAAPAPPTDAPAWPQARPTDAPAWPPPPPPNWTTPAPSAAPPSPWEHGPLPPPPPGAGGERNRLVLARGAKRWLVFATVWGSILLVGYASIFSIVGVNNANNAVNQYNTVLNDYNASKGAINAAIAQIDSCTTVSCLRASHLAAASSLDKFNSDLAAMNLPSNAQVPAQVVESDLTQLGSVFTDLANSASPQAYRATLQTSHLQTLLNSLTNDTNSVLDALRSNIL